MPLKHRDHPSTAICTQKHVRVSRLGVGHLSAQRSTESGAPHNMMYVHTCVVLPICVNASNIFRLNIRWYIPSSKHTHAHVLMCRSQTLSISIETAAAAHMAHIIAERKLQSFGSGRRLVFRWCRPPPDTRFVVEKMARSPTPSRAHFMIIRKPLILYIEHAYKSTHI